MSNDSTVIGKDGSLEVVVPSAVVESVRRTEPLLRGLLVAGAGYAARDTRRFQRRHQGQALLIHCVRGRGWCENAGRLHAVRQGDLLVLGPDEPCVCGTHPSNPWTIHWVQAAGALLPSYLSALRDAMPGPVRPVGDDLQFPRLFGEIVDALRHGYSFARLLHASSALGYWLSLLIQKRPEQPAENADAVSKVAETIIYMSDHLDEPLRVPALARMASLSPAYFGELFKAQAGCSPREYLHLLRIHRACRLLRDTALNVKEIAARLGYQDQFHFSRQFKAFQGMSPSQYRQAR